MTHRKNTTPTKKTSAPANNGKPVAEAKPARERRTPARTAAAEPAPAKTPKETTPEPASPPKKRAKSGKMSALDAAAIVLAESGQPMTCQEMIDAMKTKGYWSSPAGHTPSATLYSAILRELTTKGAESRFVKTERGKFAQR